jgi:hypothetical protein
MPGAIDLGAPDSWDAVGNDGVTEYLLPKTAFAIERNAFGCCCEAITFAPGTPEDGGNRLAAVHPPKNG